MKQSLILPIVFLSCLIRFVAASETIVSWEVGKAESRQVFEIRSAADASSLLIEIPIRGNGIFEQNNGNTLFVDAADQKTPLACFQGEESFFVVYKGSCGPKRPARIIAYRGKDIEASPRLDRKPEIVDDYATTQLVSPWDFQDGKASSITSWGVGREHYGDVTVEDGWLDIPILGNDVYFIFGVMWGNPQDPKALQIDSSIYRYLEIRLRQSCDEAEWRFYVTDEDGVYRMIEFTVKGKEPRNVRFDLKDIFPDFWDGRKIRAVRIDPIKKRPKTVAGIDYVRILPESPSVVAGPMFDRKAFEARQTVRNVDVKAPKTTVAGARTPISFEPKDKAGKPLAADLALPWTTAALERTVETSKTGKNGVLAATLPAVEKAGTVDWTAGIADDLGEPMFVKSGKIAVEADKLSAYRLTARRFVDVADKKTLPVAIVGIDRFGNEISVDVPKPKWSADNGASVVDSAKSLHGKTASVSVRLSDKPLFRHRITLTDERGISGFADITTVAFRKDMIRLNENGYMVRPDGELYYAVGGLYANWPHGKPNEKGALNRSVDLFPCSNIPYTHGFPWPEDVEKKVVEYLDHCKSHGLNSLRLMLRNMDIVGRVDPVQLKAVLHYFDLARERGIKFNVVLFEDYQKPPYVNEAILENLVLPHYTKEQLDSLPPHRARFLVERKLVKSAETRYSDPDVLECHKDYLRELIPVLAGRDEVLNYEFENEMYVQPIEWCREIAAFIRTIDPHTMILANPHHIFWPKPIPWRKCSADLIAYHPYNNGLGRDGKAAADMGSGVFYEGKMAAAIGLPFNTGEGGVYDGQIPYDKDALEQRVRGARDQIWMNLCAGGNGFMYWTVMHEQIIAEFGKFAPAMKAIGIDLKNVKRKRADLAVVMPVYEGETITWAHGNSEANQNGKALCMRLLSLGVDFDTPVIGEDTEYPVRLDVLKTRPDDVDPSLSPTVAKPGDGWDLATLLSADGRTSVLYLRNIAGGIEDFGAEKRPCYCRVAETVEATLRLRHPERWRKIVAYDLDGGKTVELKPESDGTLRLGNTRSDFVIGLQ